MKGSCSATSTAHGSLVFECGENQYIYDADGRRYLDWALGPASANLGWNLKEIRSKLARFVIEGRSGPGGNEYKNAEMLRLSQRLAELTPGDFGKVVFFSNSGGEANEAAFYAAFQKRHDRSGVLSFMHDFHGRMGFSRMGTTSKSVHVEGAPKAVQCYYLPFPAKTIVNPDLAWISDTKQYMAFAKNYLRTVHKTINVAELELIQGEGGIVIPNPETIHELVGHLQSLGIFVLDDEVQTGLGRTGKMWAAEHFGIVPDIMTISKSLGGGYFPIGATVLRETMDFVAGGHSNTCGGNPQACMVGNAVLDVLLRDDGAVIKNAKCRGEYMDEVLGNIVNDSPWRQYVSRFEGIGLMRGITFTDNNGEPYTSFINNVATNAEKLGMTLMPAGLATLRLYSPLCASEGEIIEGIEILVDAINMTYSETGSGMTVK